MSNKKSIVIIGGGPAAMMLAASLNKNKFNISIYEKNVALGRKFLVAGKGGFNLTHSESINDFISRYSPQNFIAPFLTEFNNADLRAFLKNSGIETYVGTSKRVFPIKGTKPIEVLKAFEKKLADNNVEIFYNHEWKGWNRGDLLFSSKGKTVCVKTNITVFALGGASWKVTGSDGSWMDYFKKEGIQINDFYPSNCAYKVEWTKTIIDNYDGSALKNCVFSCGCAVRKGEAVITKFGIEGSGIYPLSPEIRTRIIEKGKAEIFVDLKPDLTKEELKERLMNRGKQSVKDVLEKKINLTAIQIGLLKSKTTKEQYNDDEVLCKLIKSLPITVIDFAPIDEAISTVGGIALSEMNADLELIKKPGNYCIGEMLDWDAPTGGYLLQACFSMGKFLANKLNNFKA